MVLKPYKGMRLTKMMSPMSPGAPLSFAGMLRHTHGWVFPWAIEIWQGMHEERQSFAWSETKLEKCVSSRTGPKDERGKFHNGCGLWEREEQLLQSASVRQAALRGVKGEKSSRGKGGRAEASRRRRQGGARAAFIHIQVWYWTHWRVAGSTPWGSQVSGG